ASPLLSAFPPELGDRCGFVVERSGISPVPARARPPAAPVFIWRRPVSPSDSFQLLQLCNYASPETLLASLRAIEWQAGECNEQVYRNLGRRGLRRGTCDGCQRRRRGG